MTVIIVINPFVIIPNFCNHVDKELTKKSSECRALFQTSIVMNSEQAAEKTKQNKLTLAQKGSFRLKNLQYFSLNVD